jgi:putative transferase (TIGR04331 family)
MFLAATGLEETWNADDELLFLGPWCLKRDRREAWGARRHQVLPDPWAALEDRQRAARECADIHDRLLEALGSGLEGLHGEKRSPNAWRVLLSPWLVRYVQVMMDRYRRLTFALDRHPGFKTVRLARKDRIFVGDAYGFFVASFEDPYNFQLVTSLLDALGVEAPEIPLTVAPPSDPAARIHDRAPAGAAKRAGRWLVDRAAGARRWPIMLHGMPSSGALSLSLAPEACVLGARLAPVPPSRREPKRSNLLAAFRPKTSFESVLAKTLADDVPSLYVEGYARLRGDAEAAMPHPPLVLASADGWTFDESFKACAARAADAGTRLVAIQHGGGYGLYARIWQEETERSVADSYWTWGWAAAENDGRLRDAPAPSLSFAPDDGRPGEGLLLVGTYQPLWRYGFQSQPQAEQFESYLNERGDYFAALPPSLRKASSARLSFDMGWDQAGRLSARAPEVAVERPNGPLHERLRSAALSVFDHPATSFLEALALGRPTLLFWNPEAWDARPQARPLLEALRRARVLHDDPASAARETVEAMKNPSAWWSRPDAREAVAAFRERYCLTSPDWKRIWTSAFREELSAAKARA